MRASLWSLSVLGLLLAGCGRSPLLLLDDGDGSGDPTDDGPDPPTTDSPSTCGNGARDAGEVCDGLDLGGQTCDTQGYQGGLLECLRSCTGFDFDNCITPTCGNGSIESGEPCDGADLGGQTCESLGLGPGQLLCRPDCADFDTIGCGASCQDSDLGQAVGPAVASGSTVNEDDDLPQSCAGDGIADHVMGFVASAPGRYTFDTFGSAYDTALSFFASCHPSSELACNDDTGDGVQSQITVTLSSYQRGFVVVDGFANNTGDWVLNITPPSVPALPSCAELDVLWELGNPVATGSTVGEDEDFSQSCAAGGAVETVVRFIAPSEGRFTFSTVGSDYDTALSIHDSCGPGSELACNDDTDDGVESVLSIDLDLGEQILLAISGYGGEMGNWRLEILAE